MTILEELNTLIEDQGIPVETGLFSKPPDLYLVLTPLVDLFDFMQIIYQSLKAGSKAILILQGNYMKIKNTNPYFNRCGFYYY